MGARHVAVGSDYLIGQGASAGVLAVVFSLVLGACADKFSATAAENNLDLDSGSSMGAAGNDAAQGGCSGSGGSGGGATDSGPPEATAADVRADSPVAPPIPSNGLILWLRADAGISRGEDSVAQWRDQSSAMNHAIQPAADLRPRLLSAGIAGNPSVDFDGADDFLALPSGFDDFSDGLSIFVVALQHSTDACAALVQLSNGSEIDDITLGQFNGQTLYEVADQYFSGEAFPIGSPQLLAVVHAPDGPFVLRRNGRPSSEGTSMLPAEIERRQNFVGNSLYANCRTFPGQVAEVVIYTRAVSNQELFTIEAYLRDRSNIQ